MSKFRNEKGLTLIELLITISVLAVVSAIALPVINNVVTSSNSNALQQSIKDADAFIKKYSASGVVLYDGLKTLTGYVDTDGDNVIEAGEKMDSLTLDDKYSMSVTGSASLGGSYTNGGVIAAIITASASSNTNAGGSTPTPSPSQGATPSRSLAGYTYSNILNIFANGTNSGATTSAIWTTTTPVLAINQDNEYAWVSVTDAVYTIDYYASGDKGAYPYGIQTDNAVISYQGGYTNYNTFTWYPGSDPTVGPSLIQALK